MKKLIISLALCLISTLNAAEITGTVKRFSGLTIETNMPYSYIALATDDGQRIVLPSWLDAAKLLESKEASILTFDAEVEAVFCTDMSAACFTGSFSQVKSFKIEFPNASIEGVATYSGKLKRFFGMAIESPRLYNYVAINTRERIAVPTFLNADALLGLKAELTVIGKMLVTYCTDMSASCGPTFLEPLVSVQIQF
jgi:hypothetical protein